MTDTVSVVIPVYNDAEKLEQCLKSLLDHTSIPLETVIVNDGSTDDPAAVAAKFGCRILTLGGNHGPAYARNRGVEACRGTIILFADADCVVMPDWAAKAAANLGRIRAQYPETAALYGRLDSSDDYVARSYAYTSYAYAQDGRPGFMNYLNTACAAVYREAFQKAGGFSEDMRVNEDPDLALKLVEADYRVYFDPRSAYCTNTALIIWGIFCPKNGAGESNRRFAWI